MAGFLLATCGISSLNARQYVSFPRDALEPLIATSVLPCMKLSAFDPAHWRRRAEECRKVAEQLDDPGRPMILEIAQTYERLAKATEKQHWSPH